MNKALGAALVLLGIAAQVALVATTGCQVGDAVRVSVPTAVQEETGAPPRVSYNEALEVYEDWRAQTMRTAERFRAELTRRGELVSLLTSLGNSALAAGVPVLEELPAGGFAATAAMALGAWILPPPGAAGRLRREKEASFNAGLKRSKEGSQ